MSIRLYKQSSWKIEHSVLVWCQWLGKRMNVCPTSPCHWRVFATGDKNSSIRCNWDTEKLSKNKIVDKTIISSLYLFNENCMNGTIPDLWSFPHTQTSYPLIWRASNWSRVNKFKNSLWSPNLLETSLKWEIIWFFQEKDTTRIFRTEGLSWGVFEDDIVIWNVMSNRKVEGLSFLKYWKQQFSKLH